MDVLITGATGQLGHEVVRAASTAGHAVRAMSRRPHSGDTKWVHADLVTGEGLAAACSGAEAVVHLASDPKNSAIADVEGTRRLAEAARGAGVRHFLYLSIVGIDRIPVEYYRHKRAAEQVVIDNGLPHTILRASQFHSLIDSWLRGFTKGPFVIVPAGFQVQSIGTRDVAEEIVAILGQRPVGRAPDLAGPEPMTLARAARVWCEVRRIRKVVVPVPIPGRRVAAFRAGWNTVPGRPRGQETWRDWLEREATREA